MSKKYFIEFWQQKHCGGDARRTFQWPRWTQRVNNRLPSIHTVTPSTSLHKISPTPDAWKHHCNNALLKLVVHDSMLSYIPPNLPTPGHCFVKLRSLRFSRRAFSFDNATEISEQFVADWERKQEQGDEHAVSGCTACDNRCAVLLFSNGVVSVA